MADISKLEQQANLLMQNVSGWESRVLKRIGGRIGHYGKLSLADVKAINNIAVVKSDMDAITKELAKVTGYNISQIEQMYGELLEEQHLANEPLYDYRGKKFVPFAENRELQAIARAYAKTTGETMINLAKTKLLGFTDANGKFTNLQKAYTDVLDKAVMQVTTGATDFHTAMRDSIIELGGSGVRVDYGGGVTRRLDTVVRQNLLWGAKQASVEYNEIIGEELGCDGYEVDWHSNPRPSHEFMQGKQFAVGKARTINGVHFDSFDEAEKRLQDYGCLHYKTPIICGISEPRYSPEELKRLNEQNAKRYTIDGKEYSGYEVTQMQRRLETAVRNEKSIKNTAQSEGDKKLVRDCNAKIKAYQTKYNEISEITGIQGDKKRMSVPRGATSVKGATPKVEPPKPKTMSKHYDALETDEQKRKFIQESTGVSYEDAELQYGSISRYGGMDYTRIRRAGYQGGSFAEETTFIGTKDVTYGQMADYIEDFIDNSPKWESEIYRGINLPKHELEQLKVGGVIDMQGVSSWTSNFDIAESYSFKNIKKTGNQKIIFHSDGTKQGTSIRHLAHYDFEDEVLVSRKAKWSISNIEKIEDTTHIYVTELER